MSKLADEALDGVRLTLTVHPPSDCPLNGHSGKITSSHRQVDDESCHCRFVVQSMEGIEETHQHFPQEMTDDERCICNVVSDHGATAIMERIDGDALTLTTYLDHREEACELYEDVKSYFPEVELDRIATVRNEDDSGERVSVDVSKLTDKQRKAIKHAMMEGYYGNPRGITLEALADDLGISRQALTHRLRAAERKLLGQMFAERADELDCF